jgi:hypothetical protein
MCWLSGRFSAQNIHIDYRYNEASVHQYLIVDNAGPIQTRVYADPWAYIALGAPLGKTLSTLHHFDGTAIRSPFRNRAFEQCLERCMHPRNCYKYTLRAQNGRGVSKTSGEK